MFNGRVINFFLFLEIVFVYQKGLFPGKTALDYGLLEAALI